MYSACIVDLSLGRVHLLKARTMSSQIEQAIRQICEEKGLSYEAVLETVDSALAAAYRKDFGDKNQNIEVEFDVETSKLRAFDIKTVVPDVDLEEVAKTEEARRARMEERGEEIKRLAADRQPIPPDLLEPLVMEGPTFNPKTEIMFKDARLIESDAEVGEVLRMELPVPGEFGRMAAMTAKQVVMQKLREAEREVVYGEFKEYEHTCLVGTIQRREGKNVLVDLGRTTGLLRPEDQIPTEHYRPGERLKMYVRSVALTTRGPEILLSRTDVGLVKCLFTTEIPEIGEGAVEVKGMAREPGSRTKVAVSSPDNSIDPIGACIGQRGTRIQTIISELGGEKIDIIEWSANLEEFISHALSPAKVTRVEITEAKEGAEATADVYVPEDQLSLAVGRGGQNVRLACRLAGVHINIKGAEIPEQSEEATELATEKTPAESSVE